jgi:hypothetical protein
MSASKTFTQLPPFLERVFSAYPDTFMQGHYWVRLAASPAIEQTEARCGLSEWEVEPAPVGLFSFRKKRDKH